MRAVCTASCAAVLVLSSACIIHIEDGTAEWGRSSQFVRGSGVRRSEARELPAFRAVSISGAYDVEIEVEAGALQEVVIDTDDNLLSLVETRVDAETLFVRTQKGFSTRRGIHVRVRAPELSSLSASGSNHVALRGMSGQNFRLETSGSTELVAAGEVEELDVDLSGSSAVDLGDLIARRARITASGSTEAEVHATEHLALELSGSASITYAGFPRIALEREGSASVRPKE